MEILRTADKFAGLLSLADVRAKAEDFIVDRLSYKFTTSLLCLFGVFSSIRSLYTTPIICWMPPQLRRYERAITAYCYANNTYYIPEDQRVPKNFNERYEGVIVYYQWLPWIFLLQAMLCYAPKLVWRLALSGSRQDVSSMLKAASELYIFQVREKNVEGGTSREKKLAYLVSQLFGSAYGDRIGRGCDSGVRRRFYSQYLIICYIGVKVLYVMNCIVQIGLIHLMIGSRPLTRSRFNHLESETFEKHFIGQFVKKMSSGLSELIDTSAFPKRTLCDFTFRELASNHAYTVECLLPLNILVEKAYVFLYIWFVLLGLIIMVDLVKWILQLIHCVARGDKTRINYVKTHLIDRAGCTSDDIKSFVDERLTGNNYFMLKLISKNISTFAVVDILEYFFKKKRC